MEQYVCVCVRARVRACTCVRACMCVYVCVTGFAKTSHLCTQWQEHFSSQIDSSINMLPNYCNTTAKSWLVNFFWGLFLRPVGHTRVLGCSLMPLISLYRQPPKNHHLTRSWCRPWIYLYFVTFWVQWGLILGYFTLKIVKLHCSPPLCGYSPLPHPPPLYKLIKTI